MSIVLLAAFAKSWDCQAGLMGSLTMVLAHFGKIHPGNKLKSKKGMSNLKSKPSPKSSIYTIIYIKIKIDIYTNIYM